MNRKDWFTACSAVEKEALYRAELENYSEKLVVNGEGRIVFINEKYAAEFGKTPADIEGMTMAELFSRIKAPVILDIRDFDIPFIPHVDAVPGKSDGYIPIFIRSPLMDEKGAHVGDMIYDGQTWLRRYRGLYDKLNELVDEYQYLHAAKRSNTNARFVGSSTAVVSSSGRSSWRPRPTPPSSSREKRGPARRWWPTRSFPPAPGAGSGSSPSTAPPSRRSSSNPSFSAMRRGPSPAPAGAASWAFSSWPTRA